MPGGRGLPRPPSRKCHLMDNPSPARFLAICRAGPHPQRGTASHLCLRRCKGYLFCALQPACLASPLPKPAPLPHPFTLTPENPELVSEAAVRFGKKSTRVEVGRGVFEDYKELVTFGVFLLLPPHSPQSQSILSSESQTPETQDIDNNVSFNRRVLLKKHSPVGASSSFPLESCNTWYSNTFAFLQCLKLLEGAFTKS